MSNSSTLVRSLVIYGICVPLALFLGYILGGLEDPLFLLSPGSSSFWMVGSIIAVLATPFFLRWHHAWLIASWNVTAVLFFAPGRPQFWMPLVLISFTISLLQHIINPGFRFLRVPSVTRPLIFLVVVVLVT